LSNPALADGIARGNLPSDVEVLKEYAYGPKTDEGRGMRQILHNVAPGVEKFFR
jgi:hypothetical protein